MIGLDRLPGRCHLYLVLSKRAVEVYLKNEIVFILGLILFCSEHKSPYVCRPYV